MPTSREKRNNKNFACFLFRTVPVRYRIFPLCFFPYADRSRDLKSGPSIDELIGHQTKFITKELKQTSLFLPIRTFCSRIISSSSPLPRAARPPPTAEPTTAPHSLTRIEPIRNISQTSANTLNCAPPAYLSHRTPTEINYVRRVVIIGPQPLATPRNYRYRFDSTSLPADPPA
jgi:hypothetical protein